MEPSPQGSRRRRRETPEIPDSCVPHKQASSGTSHPTSIQHPSRQDVILSTCEIPTRRIPASFLGHVLLWIASVCFHLLTCTFRSREGSLPPFKYFLRVDIEGLVLGGRQRGLLSWFELWNEIYHPGHSWETLFLCWKRLEGISSLFPLRCIIIQKQA